MAATAPLRLLWMDGIVNSSGARSVTTERFFKKENLTPNKILGDEEVVLYVSNPKKTIEFFSHEADRFATACFESLISESEAFRNPRSVGWPLIKAYYAAFFALHALIRVHGWSCTKLSRAEVSQINQQLNLIDPEAQSLSAGLYFLRSKNGGAEVVCKKLNMQNGGSHEALWSLFPLYVDELDTALLRSTEDDEVKEFSAALEKFQKLIEGKGGATWFTQVRNRLNYSHSYGAWYPYSKSTCDIQRVQTALNMWRLIPSEHLLGKTKDELIEFSEACAFLVSLCRITLEDLVFRSKSNSPFVYSSAKILSLAKVATKP